MIAEGSGEEAELASTALASALVSETLRRLDGCGLPHWLLGAGAIAQTVWNARLGFDDAHGIADLDVVYFDPGADAAADEDAQRMVLGRLGGLGVRIDVKNQARVHEWYQRAFGQRIRPYTSIEDAVASWPTTATAVGVRIEEGNVAIVSAFGLTDLFDLVVRPNRVQVPRAVFEAKAARWQMFWPQLNVMPWSKGVGTEAERILQSPAP